MDSSTKEDKIFMFSCLFAAGSFLYLFCDILKKTRKTNKLLSKSLPEPKSIDQKLYDLSVSTPTKLHPYQKKLASYSAENTSFNPGINKLMNKGQISLKSPLIFHAYTQFFIFYVYIIHKGGENLIYRICLTGGPSSGKTTAKAVISERLSERGIRVITVPLTPTLTIENGFGAMMPILSKDDLIKYQVSLMKMQMNLEDYFTDLALLGQEKAVILCDRGVMDSKAYVSEEEWQMILDDQDWNLVNLRDRRYDAVIHMVTSANGAEDYFKSENKELEANSKVFFI